MTGHDDGAPAPIPPGFERVQSSSPFADTLGPLYLRRDGDVTVVAMRVEERHTNRRAIAHGGMLASLADCALSLGLSVACEGRHSFVTVNLSSDFVDAARPGDWLEGHVDVQRIGRRVAFANCYLQVGEKRILRASGVFATMKPLTQAQPAADY
jgi:uncharacterized protein (TIGR00369 family)